MSTNTSFPQDWQQLYDSWPPEVSREQIYRDTKLLRPQTLANMDCDGTGIPGKKQPGRHVVYPKYEAIKWLIKYVNK